MELLNRIDQLVWGPWLLFLLLGTGILLMVRMDFLPLRRLGFALKCIVGETAGKASESGGRRSESGERRSIGKWFKRQKTQGGVTPFASLMTELAATIGIGNIVGVATAMVLGGPGALFWMIAASVFGLAIKLVESALSVKYRCKNEKGEWVGGPMYTLKHAFPGKIGTILAGSYAFFAVMASFGMGNMTQSNAIAQACQVTFCIPTAKTGLVLTLRTILVVLGGIRGITKVTQILVPFMGAFYLLGTLAVILMHPGRLAQGIGAVFVMAFAPEAVKGGLFGQLAVTASLSMARSMRYGISRGVFSNEAGIGAAGITAAAADTDDHIRQGYISMTGVFFDTMIICLFTGLAFATSGLLGSVTSEGELLNGTELAIAVFEGTFGVWGSKFVCISIVLFAYATIVAWAYQGAKAFEYLAGGSRYSVWYHFVYVLVVFLGAVCPLDMVWNFSDICNGLMAVPNLLGVLVLGLGRNGMCEEILRYDNRH